MDLERVEKKLREAEFFFRKMAEQEQRAFGDKEPFDFYLSAFLSAARTVDYRLRREQGAVYRAWRDKWDSALSPGESTLIKFMVDDRNVEVHESGSSRTVTQEDIKVFGSYSDKSGTLEVFTPPGMPPTTIRKPTYSFSIAGADRSATTACAEYLRLLTRMVSTFGADHP